MAWGQRVQIQVKIQTPRFRAAKNGVVYEGETIGEAATRFAATIYGKGNYTFAHEGRVLDPTEIVRRHIAKGDRLELVIR